MSRLENQIDKIFIRTPYTVHYRRLRRTRLSIEARTDYSVLFLLKGRSAFQFGEMKGELSEGQFLLFNPTDTAHLNGEKTEIVTLTLSSSYVLDCAARTRLSQSGAVVNFRSNLIEQDERLSRLAGEMAEEMSQTEAGQELFIAALIEQIVIQLLRHHANARRSDEMELSRAGLVDRRIRRAVELMHTHLDRDLPLEEIAAAAYTSPFHFARLFKKLTGTTPHVYLAGLRITRAQSLLAETDFSITEVSARVGYASPSHFTKAFRQATGMTPRAFRSALVGGPST